MPAVLPDGIRSNAGLAELLIVSHVGELSRREGVRQGYIRNGGHAADHDGIEREHRRSAGAGRAEP